MRGWRDTARVSVSYNRTVDDVPDTQIRSTLGRSPSGVFFSKRCMASSHRSVAVADGTAGSTSAHFSASSCTIAAVDASIMQHRTPLVP